MLLQRPVFAGDVTSPIPVTYARRAVLRKNQMNADALYLRGRALYLQGNSDGASAHFAQCLKVDPEHSKAREQRKMIKILTVCGTRGVVESTLQLACALLSQQIPRFDEAKSSARGVLFIFESYEIFMAHT